VSRGSASPFSVGHTYALQLGAPSCETWISQPFNCLPGRFYALSCWVKCTVPGPVWDRPGASIHLQSTTNYADFAVGRNDGSGVDSINGWRLLRAVGVVPDGVTTARIRLHNTSRATAVFDDVQLELL
jgi:hypothetical protein